MFDKDDAFTRLVRAAWDDGLAAAADGLLSESPEAERPDAAFRLAALCGVSLPAGAASPAAGPYAGAASFGAWLEKAVAAYSSAGPVVVSAGKCAHAECRDAPGGAACSGSCPFHAILLDRKTGELTIDRERCVDCGLCVEACPCHVLEDKVEVIPATTLARNGRPVIAAVAPAIVGQFGGAGIEQLRGAFKKLGYADMVEVAFFADMLTLKEAGEFDHHVLSAADLLISSCCCPIWVAMLRKVYKDLVKNVSPSVSPMVAAGRALKLLRPDCAVVFVGPCVAKKSEAKDADLAGAIDHVFTFQELKDVFAAAGIDPAAIAGEESAEYASRGGRLYARSGGVAVAVAEAVAELYPAKSAYFKTEHADGVPACKDLLSRVAAGTVDATFIEGMGCVGGCVGGPKILIPREEGRRFVDALAEASAISVATRSDCMKEVLAALGIFGADAIMQSGKAKIFERDF